MSFDLIIQSALSHFVLQLLRLSIWLVLLTVVFVPLERLFAIHPEKIFRKAIATDISYYFLSSLVPSILLGGPMAFIAWSAHQLIPSAFANWVATMPIWAKITGALIVGDIGFYWGHRLSHEIPLLWRFHAIHHSAEHIDFLVNTRAHPVDMVFTRLCGLIPLYVLGFAAPLQGKVSLIPLVVLLFGVSWGFFVHANLRWRFGPLEWFISTPAFHHWHHTNDGPTYANKNYAPMLPWIDRLFGTLYLPRNTQSKTFGIDEPVAPGLLGQLIAPFLGEAERELNPPRASDANGPAADLRRPKLAS